MEELCLVAGYYLGEKYTDCGSKSMIKNKTYWRAVEDVGVWRRWHAALPNNLTAGKMRRFLLVGTGAMMVEQGGSIPGIAHAVAIETG